MINSVIYWFKTTQQDIERTLIKDRKKLLFSEALNKVRVTSRSWIISLFLMIDSAQFQKNKSVFFVIAFLIVSFSISVRGTFRYFTKSKYFVKFTKSNASVSIFDLAIFNILYFISSTTLLFFPSSYFNLISWARGSSKMNDCQLSQLFFSNSTKFLKTVYIKKKFTSISYNVSLSLD